MFCCFHGLDLKQQRDQAERQKATEKMPERGRRRGSPGNEGLGNDGTRMPRAAMRGGEQMGPKHCKSGHNYLTESQGKSHCRILLHPLYTLFSSDQQLLWNYSLTKVDQPKVLGSVSPASFVAVFQRTPLKIMNNRKASGPLFLIHKNKEKHRREMQRRNCIHREFIMDYDPT